MAGVQACIWLCWISLHGVGDGAAMRLHMQASLFAHGDARSPCRPVMGLLHVLL